MTNGIPHRGIPFFVADDVRYNFSVYDVVRKGMPTSMRQGFDNEKYIELQAANIRKRIAQFGGKLYLEFGGKLFDDYHASRVLPGFQPDSKIRMLQQLRDEGGQRLPPVLRFRAAAQPSPGAPDPRHQPRREGENAQRDRPA